MSAVAPAGGRTRSYRRPALIGALLIAPRFVLAALVLPDASALLLQLASFALVAGGVVLAFTAVRWWGSRDRGALPLAVVGLAALLVAGGLVAAFPAGRLPVAYGGGVLAPPAAIALGWGYLGLGLLSQTGLFVLVGSLGLAVRRWRARR